MTLKQNNEATMQFDPEETQNKPQIGEYKGNPVLTLNPNERFPFTFGLSKAKLILQYYEDIKKFVEEYDTKK